MEKEESFFSKDKFFNKPFFDQSPETEKERINQRSDCVGYFCSLVQAGEKVQKGQKIGFIQIKGLDKEEIIEAEADGIIKEILPKAETGFTANKIKEQYETTDEEGNKQQKERTLTSVEYGQTLFILEAEKLSSSKPDK